MAHFEKLSFSSGGNLLRVKKWLNLGLYKAPNKHEGYFLYNLPNALDNLLKLTENLILISDFNLTSR